MGIKKGFQVVFSEELPDRESIVPCEDRNKKSQVGTISYIPAVFGCTCAQAVVTGLMAKFETLDNKA
jgi:tRNA A37 threonylcarbamoyladenosine dehydratase